MTLSPGTRLGPYKVLSELGSGGMGQVYLARDDRLDREVALKVLPDDVASDPARLKRFENEARAASALNHPNIVTIYDVGTSGAVAWIAMEKVDGRDRCGRCWTAMPCQPGSCFRSPFRSPRAWRGPTRPASCIGT